MYQYGQGHGYQQPAQYGYGTQGAPQHHAQQPFAQGYPAGPYPQAPQPAARSSSKAGMIIAIIAVALLGLIGIAGAGVYVFVGQSGSELAQHQSVPDVTGLRIPGGGTRNPGAKAGDVSYTYGQADSKYVMKFLDALKESVEAGGWKFARNTDFPDSLVYDCTSPKGRRVGALVSKDSQGRVLLTFLGV